MSLGKKIKALRNKNSMTLSKISDETGLSIATLSRIENDLGSNSPRRNTLLSIANALGVKLEELQSVNISENKKANPLRIGFFHGAINAPVMLDVFEEEHGIMAASFNRQDEQADLIPNFVNNRPFSDGDRKDEAQRTLMASADVLKGQLSGKLYDCIVAPGIDFGNESPYIKVASLGSAGSESLAALVVSGPQPLPASDGFKLLEELFLRDKEELKKIYLDKKEPVINWADLHCQRVDSIVQRYILKEYSKHQYAETVGMEERVFFEFQKQYYADRKAGQIGDFRRLISAVREISKGLDMPKESERRTDPMVAVNNISEMLLSDLAKVQICYMDYSFVQRFLDYSQVPDFCENTPIEILGRQEMELKITELIFPFVQRDFVKTTVFYGPAEMIGEFARICRNVSFAKNIALRCSIFPGLIRPEIGNRVVSEVWVKRGEEKKEGFESWLDRLAHISSVLESQIREAEMELFSARELAGAYKAPSREKTIKESLRKLVMGKPAIVKLAKVLELDPIECFEVSRNYSYEVSRPH